MQVISLPTWLTTDVKVDLRPFWKRFLEIGSHVSSNFANFPDRENYTDAVIKLTEDEVYIIEPTYKAEITVVGNVTFTMHTRARHLQIGECLFSCERIVGPYTTLVTPLPKCEIYFE